MGNPSDGYPAWEALPYVNIELYIFARFLLLGVPSFLEVKNSYLYFKTHLKCYLVI